MDLISREAAIEEFEDMVTSVSVYGESAEARYATNARIRFVEKLNSIPTVPAVPLDKLCERLVNFSECPSCSECKLYGIKCGEYWPCGSKEHWKVVLTKWMEEQDAVD